MGHLPPYSAPQQMPFIRQDYRQICADYNNRKEIADLRDKKDAAWELLSALSPDNPMQALLDFAKDVTP